MLPSGGLYWPRRRASPPHLTPERTHEIESVTLRRHDWIVVAHELDLVGRDAPAGLRERIAALLAHVEPGWTEEACTLGLDPVAAEAVRAIVRRARGEATDPALDRAAADGVAEANRIVRDHRPPSDPDQRRTDR